MRTLTYVKRVLKLKVSIFLMDFNDFFMFDASILDAKIDPKSIKILCKIEVGLGTSFFSDFFDFRSHFGSHLPPKTAPKSTSNLSKIVSDSQGRLGVVFGRVLNASWTENPSKKNLSRHVNGKRDKPLTSIYMFFYKLYVCFSFYFCEFLNVSLVSRALR